MWHPWVYLLMLFLSCLFGSPWRQLHVNIVSHKTSPCPNKNQTSGSVSLLQFTVQVIEDLRRELEHLQMLKLEGERPGRSRTSSTSMADFNSRSRDMELEHEVKRLKQVQVNFIQNSSFHDPAACITFCPFPLFCVWWGLKRTFYRYF